MELFQASLWLALVAVASYLYGNVNNAVLISRLLGKDIRKQGSGNPGTLNMSRTFGMGVGVLVLTLDIFKGVIPSLVSSLCFGDACFASSTYSVGVCARYVAGFFAVLGHVFPVLYRFKGGKGVATTIGVLAVCDWKITLAFGLVAIAFIIFTGVGSVGSFIATTPPAIIFFVLELLGTNGLSGGAFWFFVIAESCLVLTVLLVYFAHRENLVRLFKGEEHKTDWLGMLKKLGSKKKKKEEATSEPRVEDADGEN